MATATTPEEVIVDGEEFYQWKVVLRIPKNWTPESGVFIAVAPPGGIANFPAAIQGKAGLSPVLRNIVIVDELEWDSPEQVSAEWVPISPGTETTPPVYDEHRVVRKGQPGPEAILSIMTAADLDVTNIAEGYIIAVRAIDGDPENGYEAEVVAQKVGDMYWPTAVNVLSDATGANTLCPVVIPQQPWPYRLCVEGQAEVAPDGIDIQVDLVARLGGTGTGTGEVDGTVIARGLGLAGGARQIIAFTPSPPVNSAAGFGTVPDGASRTVYIRLEQQGSGTSTVDTITGRSLYSVRVEPLP